MLKRDGEARLATKAEQDALARRLSFAGDRFVKSSDSYARGLRDRTQRFKKSLGFKDGRVWGQ